jgi:hypothetical protein
MKRNLFFCLVLIGTLASTGCVYQQCLSPQPDSASFAFECPGGGYLITCYYPPITGQYTDYTVRLRDAESNVIETKILPQLSQGSNKRVVSFTTQLPPSSNFTIETYNIELLCYNSSFYNSTTPVNVQGCSGGPIGN